MATVRRRRTTRAPNESFLFQLQPVVTVVVLALSGVGWCYNTFAQITTVRDEVANIKTMIEHKHQSAIQYSDQNKEIMLNSLSEIKESLRQIQDKLIYKGINK